jgi:hypothetical protein
MKRSLTLGLFLIIVISVIILKRLSVVTESHQAKLSKTKTIITHA